ncbi:MAG: glycosyltransferase family 2 protein [Planctomycetota bacterium]|jgi:cellulose synthase/poly-beta-1,6-N-acetylglucosamine synthase-like glycosyltransferase
MEILFWTSIILIAYVYIGYPCFLTLFGSIRWRKLKIADIKPSVTLIISAFNEEKCIREKIENSLVLDYPKDKYEIVVVSDASTDDTDRIVRQFEKRGVHLVRQEERLGKTVGLNLAVSQAKGQIIVFSDANAMYQKDAIRKLVRHFNDGKIGYVVGEARYTDINQTGSAKSENLYWQYEIFLKKMESRLHSVVGGDGAIYAIRRELYEDLLSSDISDFVNPLQIILKGFRGVYEPEAVCWEDTAGSFKKEFQRKVRIVNRSFSGLLRMRSVLNPFKTGIFSLEIISHKLLRWFVPVFLIIFILSILGISIYDIKTFQWGIILFTFFVWCTYIGYLLADHFKIWPIFYYPYYFVSINIASLIGIYRSLRGNVQTTWSSIRTDEKVERKIYDWRKSLIHIFVVIVSCISIQVIGNLFDIHLLVDRVFFWIAVAITCYVYMGYPIALVFLSKYYRKPICRKEITPEVTLLICAYNEDEIIAAKINNCFELDYPPDRLKIVIASDGSSDRTNDIVRQYKDERLCLIDYPERRGKIGVINETVPKLTSEIVLFSDANTMYRKDAVKKMVRNFADSSVGAVSADVIVHNERTSFGKSESAYYHYERWVQKKESEFNSIIGADGGMYAIRRDLFVPPSSNIILDDFVISMNVALKGYRVIYEEEAIGVEESADSGKTEFLRKSRVIAGAIQSIMQKEGVPSIKQKGLFFCYLTHKFLRWLMPIFMIGLFIANCRLSFLSGETIYGFSLALQGSFYLLALCGIFFVKNINLQIISKPFYFCLVNGAALYGIYMGIFNKQSVKWQKFVRVDTKSG